MATSYSDNLKIALQGTGDNPGTWGSITNGNLGTVLEEAIVGKSDVAIANVDTSISMASGPATSPARCLFLNITGSLSAARVLTVPNIQKTYIIKNSTTGGFSMTIASAGGGTTVSVNNGKIALVYVNGSSGVSQQFSDLVSGTTINAIAIVDLSSTQTLTNKTLTTPTITTPTITGAIMSSVTNTGTITFPTTTTTLVGTVDTATMTNKRVTPRVGTVASSATPQPTGDASDMYTVTALAANALFSAPSGSPENGQKLIIRIKDAGVRRTSTVAASAISVPAGSGPTVAVTITDNSNGAVAGNYVTISGVSAAIGGIAAATLNTRFRITSATTNTIVITVAAGTTTAATGTGTSPTLTYNGYELTWNSIYQQVGTTLPSYTTATKTNYVGCIYNAADAKWDVVAVSTQA
jgi:hypothetical protein